MCLLFLFLLRINYESWIRLSSIHYTDPKPLRRLHPDQEFVQGVLRVQYGYPWSHHEHRRVFRCAQADFDIPSLKETREDIARDASESQGLIFVLLFR